MDRSIEHKLRLVWDREDVDALVRLLDRGFSPGAVRILEQVFADAAAHSKTFFDLSGTLERNWEKVWSDQAVGVRGDCDTANGCHNEDSREAICYLCGILRLSMPEGVAV